MGTLYYQPQYKLTTLNVPAGLNASQTTGIILDDITRIDADVPGIACITYANPLDLDEAEYVGYTSISVGKELQGVTRDVEGTGAHAHVDGATVAFVHSKSHINNILDKLRGVDAVLALDVHGNEVIKTAHVDSAVNEITITNAATGNGPTIEATGETNVPIALKGKGTGEIILGQATSTGVKLAADQSFVDSSGNELIKFVKTASAVNELTIANAATGNKPTISATGGDTDIGITIAPKGGGILTFPSPINLRDANSATGDGDMVFDRTGENLIIGDGTNSQVVHMGTWTAFTPAWGSLTEGSGTNVGAYCKIGKTVHVYASFTLAADSSISGLVTLTWPVAAARGGLVPVGRVLYSDTGTNTFMGHINASGELIVESVSGSYITRVVTSATVPHTWATTDYIVLYATYEAA